MKHQAATSRAVYRDLQPTLQHREQIVLEALSTWQGEPPTSYELTEYLRARGLAFDLNSIRPRLTSLYAKALVAHAGKRKCSISGKTSYTWEPSTPCVPLPEPIPQHLF